MKAFNLDNPVTENLKIHSDLFWTFFVVTIKVASVCCFGEYLQTKQGNYTGKASLWRDRKAVWFPFYPLLNSFLGFPDSSVGKESACNAGDPGSIPGLGRSAEEGLGYPLQCSWASLVAQLIKNPPAMRETWVRSLGWEDPLEKGKATHSRILA